MTTMVDQTITALLLETMKRVTGMAPKKKVRDVAVCNWQGKKNGDLSVCNSQELLHDFEEFDTTICTGVGKCPN